MSYVWHAMSNMPQSVMSHMNTQVCRTLIEACHSCVEVVFPHIALSLSLARSMSFSLSFSLSLSPPRFLFPLSLSLCRTHPTAPLLSPLSLSSFHTNTHLPLPCAPHFLCLAFIQTRAHTTHTRAHSILWLATVRVTHMKSSCHTYIKSSRHTYIACWYGKNEMALLCRVVKMDRMS